MTFREMQDRVKYTLGLSETVANDELGLVRAWINEGVTNFVARARAYSRVINLTVQPNTKVHDMASVIISLVDIEAPDGTFPRRYTRQDITDAQASNSPGYAYEEPLFWWSPLVSAPTVITAYGVFRPQPMSADTDNLTNPNFGGLPEEFHPYVLDYALWKAGEYVQHQDSGAGEKWRIAYEGQDGFGGDIAIAKRILLKRVTPGYARRRNLSRNLGTLSPSGSYLGG